MTSHKINYFIILLFICALVNSKQLTRVNEIEAIPANAGHAKQLLIGFSLESGLPLTNYLNVIMPNDLKLTITEVQWMYSSNNKDTHKHSTDLI
jgi:hypothetical protein